MGVRGKRLNKPILDYDEPELIDLSSKEEERPKRARNTEKHRELCLLGGKWLRKHKFNEGPICTYSVVELVTVQLENPDVFGWDYWQTSLIEVKTSHADFKRDFKKKFKQEGYRGVGMYRYYLCPEGVIKPEELPERWGLLYEKDGEITSIKVPEQFPNEEVNGMGQVTILSSIMRRLGMYGKVYDFRKEKNK
jgi:hypothetical protein